MPLYAGWQGSHHFGVGRIVSHCRLGRRRANQYVVNASPKDPCQDCFDHELRAMFKPSAREKRLVKKAQREGKRAGVALAMLELFQAMDKGPDRLPAERLLARIVAAARAAGCEPKFKIGPPRGTD